MWISCFLVTVLCPLIGSIGGVYLVLVLHCGIHEMVQVLYQFDML